MRTSSTSPRRRRVPSVALLVLAGALGVAACGDKGALEPGSGLTAVTSTTVAAAPSTTAGAAAGATTAPTTRVTTTAGTAAPTTTKPAGPTVSEVAELEKALDDIDKTLSDIQAEISTN